MEIQSPPKCLRKHQEATGSPRKAQDALGKPRNLQDPPWKPRNGKRQGDAGLLFLPFAAFMGLCLMGGFRD